MKKLISFLITIMAAMSNKGVFVNQLMRDGCHINVAQTISKQYPPVYKWALHQGTNKEFFKKYLPTGGLQRKFMEHLIEHKLLPLLKWTNSHIGHEFQLYTWYLISNYATRR